MKKGRRTDSNAKKQRKLGKKKKISRISRKKVARKNISPKNISKRKSAVKKPMRKKPLRKKLLRAKLPGINPKKFNFAKEIPAKAVKLMVELIKSIIGKIRELIGRLIEKREQRQKGKELVENGSLAGKDTETIEPLPEKPGEEQKEMDWLVPEKEIGVLAKSASGNLQTADIPTTKEEQNKSIFGKILSRDFTTQELRREGRAQAAAEKLPEKASAGEKSPGRSPFETIFAKDFTKNLTPDLTPNLTKEHTPEDSQRKALQMLFARDFRQVRSNRLEKEIEKKGVDKSKLLANLVPIDKPVEPAASPSAFLPPKEITPTEIVPPAVPMEIKPGEICRPTEIYIANRTKRIDLNRLIDNAPVANIPRNKVKAEKMSLEELKKRFPGAFR